MDREKVIKGLEVCIGREPGEYDCNECPYEIDGNCCEINLAKDALALLKEQEEKYNKLAEWAEGHIVFCKDCKYRPQEPNWKTYGGGFDLEFPEGSKCPCQCSGDTYYSWYPEDDWFCANGERPEKYK